MRGAYFLWQWPPFSCTKLLGNGIGLLTFISLNDFYQSTSSIEKYTDGGTYWEEKSTYSSTHLYPSVTICFDTGWASSITCSQERLSNDYFFTDNSIVGPVANVRSKFIWANSIMSSSLFFTEFFRPIKISPARRRDTASDKSLNNKWV